MDALKLVSHSVSSVPLTAPVAVLRSVGWIFAFQAYPMFLTMLFQQVNDRGILPVRQAPIVPARERPASVLFDVSQVLNTQNFDIFPVNRFECLPPTINNVGVGVFLTLVKAANTLHNFFANLLSIRENKAVDIIAIHADDQSSGFRLNTLFFQDELHKHLPIFHAQTQGLGHLPACIQLAIDVAGSMNRQDEARRSRTDQFNRQIEVLPLKPLNIHKVIVERNHPASQAWLGLSIFFHLAANDFFGLLGKGLSQARCQTKVISPPMCGCQISQRCRKVLTLPEQINKILGGIMASVQKLLVNLRFAGIEIIQENARGTAHHFGFGMAFIITRPLVRCRFSDIAHSMSMKLK